MKTVIPWRFVFGKISTWLAALNAGGWVLVLLPFAAYLPKRLELPAVVVLFVLGWLVPVYIANIAQPKLKAKVERNV